MPKKNKLSIYLIKDEFANDDNLILKEPENILAEIEDVGTVYYVPSYANSPKWIENFYRGQISRDRIFTANARVILIVRVTMDSNVKKTFAVTMGYGKYLLEDDVVENDFGIKVVLNSITNNSLRRINKVNIGGNQKASNEQLPLASAIDEFGFDIEGDLISAITGQCNDRNITQGMISGSDLLSLNAAVDIRNIKAFLEKVYIKYCSTEYRKNFGWIDHIRRVKDSKLIDKLEKRIIELINEGDENIWMAVPEVIEWEKVHGFKYTKDEPEDDIYISKVIESLDKELMSYEQLRKKSIIAISASDGSSEYATWKAYKCLYGEVEIDGKAYCINNGQWFCIDRDFVKMVNAEYEAIPISSMEFMECEAKHNTENKYTVDFVNKNPEYMLCMDQKDIHYGGGHSQIELCDILTTDNKYVHIKPYSGSSTLSHLFNQAVVSAELVLVDKEFVMKANEKIKTETNNKAFLISSEERPQVILAIISILDVERPKIPFFSKVAIRNAKRRLTGLNCSLEIKNVKKNKI